MSTKRKALPKGIAAGEFDKAIGELKTILGAENVVVDEIRLAPYNKIMMPVPNDQHAPSAAITPASVERSVDHAAVDRIEDDHCALVHAQRRCRVDPVALPAGSTQRRVHRGRVVTALA